MNHWKHLLFIAFIFTFPFVLISFLSSRLPEGEMYGIYGYFYHQLSILLTHFPLYFLGFLILAFIISREHKKHTKERRRRRYSMAVLKTVTGLIGGIAVSYFLLFLIAFIELNLLSLIMNSSPNTIGAVTDRDKITARLESANTAPEIVTSQTGQHDLLIALAVASTGKDSYFGQEILPNIPAQSVIPMRSLQSSMVLMDNTLIFTQIDPTDIQAIGPSMGYLLVKNYFSQRPIKSYPKVYFLDQVSYIAHQRADALRRYTVVEERLESVIGERENMQERIRTAQSTATQNERLIENDQNQRDEEYTECISAGTYESGKFVRSNTPEECKELRTPWNESITRRKKQIEEAQAQILSLQTQLKDYEFYVSFLENLKVIVRNQAQIVHRELGMFDPKGSIRIVFDSSDSGSVADYFATLTHEYLHYASFTTEEKRFYSSFIEEGLTEYFARKAIEDNLQTQTHLGYPIQVRIITEMTRRIPEVDLADIYFTKDEVRLKNMLDSVYGEGFYQETLLKFEQIQYALTRQQALELANEVIERIGGTPMTEEDLEMVRSEI